MFSGMILALALSAAPSPAAASPPVIERPDWIEKPEGGDVDYHYPTRAREEKVGGRVLLRCLVQESGYVTDCEVVQETPPGYQFGAAALGLSAKFRMKPMTANGQPVGGASVMIPISFAPVEDGEYEGVGMQMPDLQTALTCYGHFASRAERAPTDPDERANAIIYAVAVLFGANQAGWSPSKLEAALTQARKSADPEGRPQRCPSIPGASEQLRDSGL